MESKSPSADLSARIDAEVARLHALARRFGIKLKTAEDFLAFQKMDADLNGNQSALKAIRAGNSFRPRLWDINAAMACR